MVIFQGLGCVCACGLVREPHRLQRLQLQSVQGLRGSWRELSRQHPPLVGSPQPVSTDWLAQLTLSNATKLIFRPLPNRYKDPIFIKFSAQRTKFRKTRQATFLGFLECFDQKQKIAFFDAPPPPPPPPPPSPKK